MVSSKQRLDNTHFIFEVKTLHNFIHKKSPSPELPSLSGELWDEDGSSDRPALWAEGGFYTWD